MIFARIFTATLLHAVYGKSSFATPAYMPLHYTVWRMACGGGVFD
jgi:hypothetical protein